MRVRVGTLEDLKSQGRVVVKAGSHGVCVFWDGDRPYALDDRCPHMGFPLHRGTVENGLVTCHWHHARFDLASGGTLDPFADNVRPFPVEVEGGEVFVVVGPPASQLDDLRQRLAEGLEQGLTLVVAKSVLGLLEAGVPAAEIVRAGIDFGTANRREGWGSGLTVLVAMANLVPRLATTDQALALVHGLSFVSRDTRNHSPRFSLTPLGRSELAGERLASWYRRFIETRSSSAAERTLLTAISAGQSQAEISRMMTAAVTDHAFLDGGHTIDFTNKAFEALEHIGWDAAQEVLPTVVSQTAAASRAEEGGQWRHPFDLASLVRATEERLPALLDEGAAKAGSFDDPTSVSALGWELLADDPQAVVDALTNALRAGATPEQAGRAVALAAGLRITRFHVQNDFGDWDTVHHGFTAANALHQSLRRAASPELMRGLVHGALRGYLDRFLNVPAARLPQTVEGDLEELESCWDEQGAVDRAGAIAYGWLKGGGDRGRLIAVLGRALLSEDAGFHWYQTVEAAAVQSEAWPEGSEESALLLTGAARFLAAHTPTRRELPHVVTTAARLRRGDDLFEAD
ncbi:MAG TPA: Rieske 2Fe-2S domain-containing protein [Acidimicrobiales bacterium]|nr:Rieske 2Fe-2S domain-containing protein [Acidimicrobiales bacterium]